MNILFSAFIDTCLLMLIAGAFVVAMVFVILSTFHATHQIELVGEGLAVLVVLVASAFVFRLMVKREKELLEPDIYE